MANTVDKVLRIANNEIGYLEKNNKSNLDDKKANSGSGNFTKYWRDLKPSFQGEPWCNAFVDWCFMKAYGESEAKRLLCCKTWEYYTPTSAGYFKQSGKWYTKDPKTGDIIYFRNDTRICHVGIVTEVKNSKVYTIEGNTSGVNEVVPNGGGVFAKSYSLVLNRIAGYGRPAYDLIETTETWKWIKDGNYWYYQNNKGENTHGWKIIKSAVTGKNYWYYFDDKGQMLKGLQDIKGETYYLLKSGTLEGACCKSDDRGVLKPWEV